MKAAIWKAYGAPDVLEVQDIEAPTLKDNEVLVKILSSAVTTGDCRMRRFDVPNGLWLPTRLAFGLFKPRMRIAGMDFSGEIVELGKGVSLFEKGDRVFGTTGMVLGANAEYMCISEKKAFVKIPDTITHIDAASLIFGGIAALSFLRGKIKPNSQVLINGASGSVGSSAVQISKNYGAKVTGICSGANKELVLSLGADDVIDYTRNDFTDNGVVYDVILDTVGNLTYSRCKKSLAESGRLILINAGLGTILGSFFNKKITCGFALESQELLQEILSLYETEKLKPVIDKVYSLDNIVDAHGYVDKGRKKGNVILKIA